MRRRQNFTLFVALLFVALLTHAIGCSRENNLWDQKFAVVEEGVLLRSSLPSIPRLEEVKQRYGIRTIVSLLSFQEIGEPESEAERKFADRNGIKFVHLPIIQNPSPEMIKRILEIVDNSSNQPVLVHCRHGIVRTGLFVAIYRMEHQGWSPPKALDEMKLYGLKANSPEYKQVTDLILGYASKR